jgi:hypothetical protein
MASPESSGVSTTCSRPRGGIGMRGNETPDEGLQIEAIDIVIDIVGVAIEAAEAVDAIAGNEGQARIDETGQLLAWS